MSLILFKKYVNIVDINNKEFEDFYLENHNTKQKQLREYERR